MLSLVEGALIEGKYRLERLLARGGMGAIWVGQDERLRRSVAIKFMEPQFALSVEARARFEREARAVAQLKTPHVVQIFDHGVDGDTPYIVMELLDGEDLGRRLKRELRLSLPVAAGMAFQIAKALRRAHEAGIVHRDLKPQNVFLARTDDEEVVKVLDFGVAKTCSVEDDTEATRTGSVLGSPKYMSPEQARGLKSVDHRSDLWSFGVILFRAVTGWTPFQGDSAGDLIVKICSDPIPLPSRLAPGLSPAVDAFFARALDRDPEKRFQSATDLARAFGELAGTSIDASVSGVSTLAAALNGGAPLPNALPLGSDVGPLSNSASSSMSHASGSVSAGSASEASVSVSTPGSIGTLSNVSSSPALPPERAGARPLFLGVLGIGTFVVLATIGFLTLRSSPSPSKSISQSEASPSATSIASASAPAAASASAAVAVPSAAPPVDPSVATAATVIAAPSAAPSASAAPPVVQTKATAAQKSAPPPAKKKNQWGY